MIKDYLRAVGLQVVSVFLLPYIYLCIQIFYKGQSFVFIIRKTNHQEYYILNAAGRAGARDCRTERSCPFPAFCKRQQVSEYVSIPTAHLWWQRVLAGRHPCPRRCPYQQAPKTRLSSWSRAHMTNDKKRKTHPCSAFLIKAQERFLAIKQDFYFQGDEDVSE